jgi:polyphosphate glucokinase
MQVFGIDIGGTGIKGAPVDTETGALLAERVRLPTPSPSKPEPVANAVADLVRQHQWAGPIGVGFPTLIRGGVSFNPANISKKWDGTNVATLFSEATGCPVYVLNDADAAGMAEMAFGAGKERMGVVMIITIGTGLGTAIFTDGHLLPNTELGHLEFAGREAERYASDATRQREKLSWQKWAKRFDEYLHELERLFSPDLFILGGGAIKKQEDFLPLLTVKAEVLPAMLGNEAGIVGAAMAARYQLAER